MQKNYDGKSIKLVDQSTIQSEQLQYQLLNLYKQSQLQNAKPVYWESMQFNTITVEDRLQMIEWFESITQKKKLQVDTLIRAICLFDLYLSKIPNVLTDTVFHIKNQYPLFVMSGMVIDIASKYEQQVPNLFKMFLLTFKTTQQYLIQPQLSILNAFNFDIGFITCYDVIDILISKLVQQDIVVNHQRSNQNNSLENSSIYNSISTVNNSLNLSGCIQQPRNQKVKLLNQTFSKEQLVQEAADIAIYQVLKNSQFVDMNQLIIGAFSVYVVFKKKQLIDQIKQLFSLLTKFGINHCQLNYLEYQIFGQDGLVVKNVNSYYNYNFM